MNHLDYLGNNFEVFALSESYFLASLFALVPPFKLSTVPSLAQALVPSPSFYLKLTQSLFPTNHTYFSEDYILIQSHSD